MFGGTVVLAECSTHMVFFNRVQANSGVLHPELLAQTSGDSVCHVLVSS